MELTDFEALSFDCYGTLIDWETGLAASGRNRQMQRKSRPPSLAHVS